MNVIPLLKIVKEEQNWLLAPIATASFIFSGRKDKDTVESGTGFVRSETLDAP